MLALTEVLDRERFWSSRRGYHWLTALENPHRRSKLSFPILTLRTMSVSMAVVLIHMSRDGPQSYISIRGGTRERPTWLQHDGMISSREMRWHSSRKQILWITTKRTAHVTANGMRGGCLAVFFCFLFYLSLLEERERIECLDRSNWVGAEKSPVKFSYCCIHWSIE